MGFKVIHSACKATELFLLIPSFSIDPYSLDSFFLRSQRVQWDVAAFHHQKVEDSLWYALVVIYRCRAKPLINAFAKKLHALGGKQEQEGVWYGHAPRSVTRGIKLVLLLRNYSFASFSCSPFSSWLLSISCYLWGVRFISLFLLFFRIRAPSPLSLSFTAATELPICRYAHEQSVWTSSGNSIEILAQISRLCTLVGSTRSLRVVSTTI